MGRQLGLLRVHRLGMAAGGCSRWDQQGIGRPIASPHPAPYRAQWGMRPPTRSQRSKRFGLVWRKPAVAVRSASSAPVTHNGQRSRGHGAFHGGFLPDSPGGWVAARAHSRRRLTHSTSLHFPLRPGGPAPRPPNRGAPPTAFKYSKASGLTLFTTQPPTSVSCPRRPLGSATLPLRFATPYPPSTQAPSLPLILSPAHRTPMASSSSSRQRSYDSLASSASMSSDSSAKRIRLEPAHFDDEDAHGAYKTRATRSTRTPRSPQALCTHARVTSPSTPSTTSLSVSSSWHRLRGSSNFSVFLFSPADPDQS